MITGDHAVTAGGDRQRAGHRGTRRDRRRVRRARRRGGGPAGRRDRRDRPGRARAQGQAGRGAQAQGQHRRDDRRRGQRRAGHRRRGHRHRHGHHRHRRRQGRGQDDPGRRQLRHHRGSRRGGAARSTTTCRSSCGSRSPTCSCSSWRSSDRSAFADRGHGPADPVPGAVDPHGHRGADRCGHGPGHRHPGHHERASPGPSTSRSSSGR